MSFQTFSSINYKKIDCIYTINLFKLFSAGLKVT